MEEQINFLEKAIKNNKNRYSQKSKQMFKIVRWHKYPLVMLSALSTIILGIQIGEDWIQWQKNLALIITAMTTLISTLMTFWNVEKYWIQNEVIEQQIEIIEQKFEFEKAKGLTQQMINNLFNELQTIVSQNHFYWKTALEGTKEINDKVDKKD